MTTQSRTVNFEEVEKEMRLHRMPMPADRIYMKVPDARNLLYRALEYFLAKDGTKAQWLPEYDRVAEWLTDNQGKGLFLYGNCGRGKSLLCRQVIPAILLHASRKVVKIYDMQEMNHKLDEVLTKGIISLDDIGSEEMMIKYGERRLAFAEIMDAAEKSGKIVIVSTNLTSDQIRSQYGDRVLDRIKAITTRVLFKGDSLRK